MHAALTALLEPKEQYQFPVSEHGKSGIAPLFLQPENLWNGAAESGNAVTAAAGNAESLECPK